MLDPDFKIERPTRYYRQGLNLLHPDITKISEHPKVELDKQEDHHEHRNSIINVFGTISSRMSKIFHVGHVEQQRAESVNEHAAGPSLARLPSSSGSSASSSIPSRAHTPMLDPSTNMDPLDDTNPLRTRTGGDEKKKKRRAGDVSKHTFYIENSQTRLKLYARSEVGLSYASREITHTHVRI